MANSLNKVTTKSILDATVATADIAADAITGAKIADDAIDSEHYTDGSIDTAHIADNQVTGDKLADDITLAGTLTLPDTITHTGDTNTKIRFPAADTVSVETGGSERLRVDSSGRLLVGHTASINSYGEDSPLQVSGTGFTDSTLAIRRDSADNGGGAVVFSKSRGSAGGVTVVQDDDSLGSIVWSGADGGDANPSAGLIKCAVDGTPGTNDMPGRLEFHTTADGAGGVSERLRIESNGIITPKAVSNRGGIAMMGAFMANPSAVYNQNSGTAVIAFDDEQFDLNGWYNHSTYTYTPEVKGWYQMNFFIQWKTGFNGNAIEVQAYYEKNGSTGPGPVEGYSTNYGNYAYVSWSPIVYFNGTGDYVKLVGNSSHNTQVSSVSEMSGFLLHPLA